MKEIKTGFKIELEKHLDKYYRYYFSFYRGEERIILDWITADTKEELDYEEAKEHFLEMIRRKL